MTSGKKYKLSAITRAILVPLSLSLFCLPVSAQKRGDNYQETTVQSVKLKPGENIQDIARSNKVSIDHLWEINSFAFSDKATFLAATAGQTVWLPVKKSTAQPQVPQTKQPESVRQVEPQAGGKANPRNMDARQFGQNQLSSLAGQQAEEWLSSFGGSARISISSDKDFSDYNYSGDVLVPLWDSHKNILLFTQLGARRVDDRNTGNIGLGVRYFADGWMMGNNVFFDNDFSGNNRRAGIGAELWTEALRLAANGYYGLNGWHQSKLMADYDERPANGWDIELSSWLPLYPQLGGKVKYEQYYGDNVALISRNNLQKDPSAVTVGLNWTPVPLVSVEAAQRNSMQSGKDTTVGLNLNWNFGRSLGWHLSSAAVAEQRSLAGSRYELVSRNNQIVMDYREQTVITFSLASAIQGVEGSSQPLGVSIWAKHGLGKIVWDDALLVAAGGKILGQGANSVLVLPAWQEGTDNHYTLSAVAYDTKGKASQRAQVQITVEKAEQIQPEEPTEPEQPVQPEEPGQPEQPDAAKTVFNLDIHELAADNTGHAQAIIELKDKEGQPVSGQAANLRLEAQLQNALLRNGSGVTVGEIKEEGTSGRYLVDLTAGAESGVVTLVLYHGANVLGQQQLTLTAVEEEVPAVVPAKIELGSENPVVTAGNTMTFTAMVTDNEGKPFKDVVVKFTDEDGNVINAANEGKTDENGRVTASKSVEKAGSYTVTSHIDDLASNAVTVTVNADLATATIKDYRANQGTFKPGQPGSTSDATFDVTLIDKFGNPLANLSGLSFKELNGYDGRQIELVSDGKTNQNGVLAGSATMLKSLKPQNQAYYQVYPLLNGNRIDIRTINITFVPE
ncbi:inverse autotransporter beta domain-containing protein [Erwiniaceae bacterium L1_54_6]|nr:inverse autotransporter beta domain-containing protein [Erwiniaceae bacterium L1_54_6]